MEVRCVHDFEMIKNLCAWMVMLFTCGNLVSAVAQDNAGKTREENDERHFDTLTVGPLSFTNVWVRRQTNAVILIRHSMGIHSIKLSDLPSNELEELKSQVGDLAHTPGAQEGGWRNNALIQKLLAMVNGSSGRTQIILGIAVFLTLLLIVVKKLSRKSAKAS